MRLRSLLYVPASSERFIAKAHERGADAIILDLEDSVAPDQKQAARDGLKEAVVRVGRGGATVFVRVNSAPEMRMADAEAACLAGAFGLYVAKTELPGELDALAAHLAPIERQIGRAPMAFVPLLEDASAVLEARAIARVQRVIGLAAGGEDIATSLGAEPLPEVLRLPKLLVHLAAKAEGKLSFGMLLTIADYQRLDAIESAAREAKAHGFDGASCIHPSVIPVLNASFSPRAELIAWAKAVIAAARATGQGAFELNGVMVDAPVIARALNVLEQANEFQ
ncbi:MULTISPECIES: CoA ester lyase [unclassified Ensifer]|uniref:HpcH/HpaI aldolase/citrate lyase family protein n=1 Tax=unclassified Ensifer TaxID=2633371 RepID=UPI000812D024|nr:MULTISPECIES: CoA ester lyase [unclassified Ensifer]OCO98841.1 citrate lyase [Ensifer sp. LC14]OCP02660.1 citrate lyase [Ensifer sp. LC11]OCP02994.1 citrate lyase [Ensifer sp. LC13]OCP29925.1 citrate lyase [Ensifer sp. LC499]